MTQPDLAARRAELTARADATVRDLVAAALPADVEQAGRGLAVVATGGYGRRELSGRNDLDLLVLHDDSWGSDQVATLMEGLTVPLWEAGWKPDASVRTPAETRELAARDFRVTFALMDARPVAGDAALVVEARSAVMADWRRTARARLQDVRADRDTRIQRSGWVAHSAVPDLKASAGGLRDAVLLRAAVASWLVDVPLPEVEHLAHALLDVRDALHDVTGRHTEKLLPELVPDVARLLGRDPEELDLGVRAVGRRLDHLVTTTWRRYDDALDTAGRRRRVTPRGPAVTPLADGVVLLGGEVVLTRDADPAGDPEVALRLAVQAARRGYPIDAGSAARLARELPGWPGGPWPESSTRLLLDLLASGEGLVPVWDELDHAGVVDHWLPEWAAVRLRGSSSPVHTWTVDRHSVEAVVVASSLRRDVARPDLLLVAALLHDVGKGLPGDHSVVGAPVAEQVARRWGLSEPDAATVGLLVRHHLLLPGLAVRRDIEDPATAAEVAAEVGSVEVLDLLAALTEADARATGPSAWTAWRAGLVRGLVAKTRAALQADVPADADEYAGWPADVPVPSLEALDAEDAEVHVQERGAAGALVTVVSRDRPGLMALVAGALATSGLQVRSVRLHTQDGLAASLWEVTREQVEAVRVGTRVRQALAGGLDLGARLAWEPSSGPAPRVEILESRASATLVGLRTTDRRGLVWAICRTIAEAGHSIRSAHLTTYGDEVRDVFYVVTADGEALDADAAGALRDRLVQALR
ncbi:[protein-PII] uridylyltransferase [Aeromicrobium massiliense]|uniref:[protein-PII] uridylyltransferase n=1 Tax=Aeromicrobium massiliense TaxID=1464554 RepID=UPI0021C3DFC3|nr:[protein-PII] uridylyltransferase [Aeromicrobium massiliense]